MKKIEAIVAPGELKDIRAALVKAGISNMMVSEIREYGKAAKHKEIYRNEEYFVDSTVRYRLETIVPYSMVSRVIEIFTSNRKKERGEKETILVTAVNDITR